MKSNNQILGKDNLKTKNTAQKFFICTFIIIIINMVVCARPYASCSMYINLFKYWRFYLHLTVRFREVKMFFECHIAGEWFEAKASALMTKLKLQFVPGNAPSHWFSDFSIHQNHPNKCIIINQRWAS